MHRVTEQKKKGTCLILLIFYFWNVLITWGTGPLLHNTKPTHTPTHTHVTIGSYQLLKVTINSIRLKMCFYRLVFMRAEPVKQLMDRGTSSVGLPGSLGLLL